MGISPNRLVAVLTPLVFAPLAGMVSVLAARHIPGLDIDSDQLQQIFIAGALIAFGKAGIWLKGWQKWEEGEHAVPEDVANDFGLAESLDAGADSAAGELDDEHDPALADADPDLDPDQDLDDEDDDAGDGDDDALLTDDDDLVAVGRD